MAQKSFDFDQHILAVKWSQLESGYNSAGRRKWKAAQPIVSG